MPSLALMARHPPPPEPRQRWRGKAAAGERGRRRPSPPGGPGRSRFLLRSRHFTPPPPCPARTSHTDLPASFAQIPLPSRKRSHLPPPPQRFLPGRFGSSSVAGPWRGSSSRCLPPRFPPGPELAPKSRRGRRSRAYDIIPGTPHLSPGAAAGGSPARPQMWGRDGKGAAALGEDSRARPSGEPGPRGLSARRLPFTFRAAKMSAGGGSSRGGAGEQGVLAPAPGKAGQGRALPSPTSTKTLGGGRAGGREGKGGSAPTPARHSGQLAAARPPARHRLCPARDPLGEPPLGLGPACPGPALALPACWPAWPRRGCWRCCCSCWRPSPSSPHRPAPAPPPRAQQPPPPPAGLSSCWT